MSMVLPPKGGPGPLPLCPPPPPPHGGAPPRLPPPPPPPPRLLPHRPCCAKSDDFSTFGSIFLEKGFEREVRTSEQPQEWAGRVWSVSHRTASTPARSAQEGC